MKWPAFIDYNYPIQYISCNGPCLDKTPSLFSVGLVPLEETDTTLGTSTLAPTPVFPPSAQASQPKCTSHPETDSL